MGAVTTWYAFDETLNAFRYFMPVSGDCWSLGRFAGMNRPDDTAAYLAEGYNSHLMSEQVSISGRQVGQTTPLIERYFFK